MMRIESTYFPMYEPRDFFSKMPEKAREELRKLNKEIGDIPRVTGYHGDLFSLYPWAGKYLAIAYDDATDLPIARVDCLIMNGSRTYGLIMDLVVSLKYRRRRVAQTLVLDLVRRMSDPDILRLSEVEKLDHLLVAMSAQLVPCRKLFESCGFDLMRSNGESIYRHRLGNP